MAVTNALQIATSLERVRTETAFDVLARAKKLERRGHGVIHLEIGEPEIDTPPHLSGTAYEAVRAPGTHDCASAGILELHRVREFLPAL